MAQVVDRTKRTPKIEQAFLEVLSAGGSVYKAAITAGVSRTQVYEWRRNDEDFALRWDEALECGTDTMEDEAYRRAVNGTEKPVFYKGDECGYIREYSDNLMMFKLKARRPEKYRERSDLNVSGDIRVIVRRFTEIEGEAEEVKVIE
jgi:transposase-like protein